MTHICWARTVPGLSPKAHSVLNALAGAADDDGLAFPSVATLELWTSFDESSIQRAFVELADCGLVEITRRNGKANEYRLQCATPRTLQPPAHSDPPQRAAKPPAHSHQTPRTVRPIKYLKDLKGGDISTDKAFAVSAGKKAQASEAYKRQGAAWVEPEKDDHGADLWKKVCDIQALELPPGFLAHLQRAKFAGMNGDTLQIRVDNVFAQDAIEGRLAPRLERELTRAAGRAISLVVLYDVASPIDA